MFWQIAIEILLKGFGFFWTWSKDKKESKKWLAETSMKLRKMRLVRQAFVEQHARESHNYIINKKEKRNDSDT